MPSKGQVVVIRSVKDERAFEQAPSDPSVPSLGLEGTSNASDELKSRAIARKRNSFGKALGDVVLENGQTVVGTVRDNLSVALRQAGYDVKGPDYTGPTHMYVDVHVRQFWAWFQPGFTALTLNMNISTDLELVGRAGPPTTVKVHAEDSRQMATEGAWLDIVNKGLAEFRTQATAQAMTLSPAVASR